ncbi:pyridoxamine 5'-phosphate oxidase family protein [Kitasatospora sp. NPDC058201]|uniref:pyridoxamine 5'-phosphate oxidase family protein n=1 Tax=Kitasatospora sp. NPDC058201 TaxID=3346379 RepID=UPI0036DE8447
MVGRPAGLPVCVTVTHLDGLILGRSAFRHSVNYRSVVPHGLAHQATDEDEPRQALEAIVNHVAPGHAAELRRGPAPRPDMKEAAPDQEVILTVHELKRLARNAAELMTLSGQLQAAGVQLELLTGPLTGIHDPNGMGAMFFAVLAAAAQIERNYIREKTLEGQVSAASKGNHGGQPKVIDDDMLTFAQALKDKGVPVPEIAKKLTIKSGKNKDQHPSAASVSGPPPKPRRPAPSPSTMNRPCGPSGRARIRRPDEPLTAEELDLRERLIAQRAELSEHEGT